MAWKEHVLQFQIAFLRLFSNQWLFRHCGPWFFDRPGLQEFNLHNLVPNQHQSSKPGYWPHHMEHTFASEKKKTLNRELLHPWGWKKLLSHFQKNWCFPWTWHRNTTNSYSPVVGIDRLTLPFLTSFPACDPWVLPSPHSTKLQIHVAIGRHGSITTCHIQNCGPHCWNCAKSHEIFHMCHMTLPHFKNVMT